MSGILWIVLVGFVAGIIARLLSPGSKNPTRFMLTTVLRIAGAFLATFVGQADGHYGPDQSSKTFETEAEAKNFARIKFAEGNAGTINPYSPRQAVASSPHPLLA